MCATIQSGMIHGSHLGGNMWDFLPFVSLWRRNVVLCQGSIDGVGASATSPFVAPAPPSPGVRRSSAEIIAFAGCWLNLAHPSRNCFLWVFMKNGWDLGIMELYPNKAKHLLKYKSWRRKGRGGNWKNDRMLMGGGEHAYFQLKS